MTMAPMERGRDDAMMENERGQGQGWLAEGGEHATVQSGACPRDWWEGVLGGRGGWVHEGGCQGGSARTASMVNERTGWRR